MELSWIKKIRILNAVLQKGRILRRSKIKMDKNFKHSLNKDSKRLSCESKISQWALNCLKISWGVHERRGIKKTWSWEVKESNSRGEKGLFR